MKKILIVLLAAVVGIAARQWFFSTVRIAGTSMDDMDAVSLSKLRAADMVISKGQANFETLNGCGMNIYYLFLCKCRRFERRFNMGKLQGVLANDRRLEC